MSMRIYPILHGLRVSFLCMLVAVLPFVAPFGIQEQVTKTVYFAVVILLSVCLLVSVIKNRGYTFSSSDRAFLLLIGMFTISSVFGIHPSTSLIQGSIRGQTVIFFLSLFIVARSFADCSDREKMLIASVLMCSVTIESVFILLAPYIRFIFPYPLRIAGRLTGTFGEPNMAAGFILVGSSIYFGFLHRKRGMAISGIILSSIAVGLTGSRTAVLSFLFYPVFLIIRNIRKRNRLQYLITLFSAVMLAIILLLFIWRHPSLYDDRLKIWSASIMAISQRPFLGYGLESGSNIIPSYYYTIHNIHLEDFVIDRTHMILLDIALWSGLGGCAVFLYWIWSEITAVWKKSTITGQMGSIAWIAFVLIQPVGIVQWVLLIFLFRGTVR